MIHFDIAALDGCENLMESYGEICVRCNKCGRFKAPTEEELKKTAEAEAEIDRLFDELFAEERRSNDEPRSTRRSGRNAAE